MATDRSIFPLRLNDEERTLLKEAAAKAGVSMTDYVREAALARAGGAIVSPRPQRAVRLVRCKDVSGAHARAKKLKAAQWCPTCQRKVTA